METKYEKITFFTRLKISIFKLEDYGVFLGERFGKALKFLAILTLLLTLVLTLTNVYTLDNMLSKGFLYIKSNIPNFEYKDGRLNFENFAEGYDEKYNFRYIIDTGDISDEKIEEYKEKIVDKNQGILILKNKIYYYTRISDKTLIDQTENNVYVDQREIDFDSLKEAIDSLNISNKEDLVAMLSDNSLRYAIATTYFLSVFVPEFIRSFLEIFMYVLIVAVFGTISSRLSGIKFKMSPICSLAIYSTTLSNILTMIYIPIYNIFDFQIKYFNFMYLLISYVYMIAAIMMIKYDLIKQHLEVAKIKEVQKQIHEELKDEKEEEKDENDSDKGKDKEKEPDVEVPPVDPGEPDGSEI